MTDTNAARTLHAARRSVTLAVARDIALDVVWRWDHGPMGRGRWLWLGPLTAIIAGAAWGDIHQAVGPVDATGRTATAVALSAVHLNVAAKRFRDLRLGGWIGALAVNGGLGAAYFLGGGGGLTVSYMIVLFLLPGDLARAARKLTVRRVDAGPGPE